MNTKVQRVSLPENRRILVTADIHAHGHLLKRLLEEANYKAGEDILIIAGDILEKGPDSLGTLRYVMALSKEKYVYPLMGNVDIWRIAGLLNNDPQRQKEILRHSFMFRNWFKSTFIDEMCREAGIVLTEDTDPQSLFPMLRERFQAEFSFILNLPVILETEKIIFVHGGIPHENLDDFVDTDCFSYLKRDDFMREGHAFRKYVIVGHTPTMGYCTDLLSCNPIADHKQKIISIDGGCGVKKDGQLNLLILEKGDPASFAFLAADDLPEMIPIEDQEESPCHHAVFWQDRWVECLEMGEEFSRISHHGAEMCIPTYFLYKEEDGRMACRDVTDYRMPVRAGEKLSLCKSFPHACLVKKNGVLGWYYGKYEIKEPIL